MWYLICYDIQNDKVRSKVAQVIDDYGTRIQYSVFEAHLNQEQVESLLTRLRKMIDRERDSLYCYEVCERCRKNVRICGRGTAFDEEIVWVV